MNMVTVPIDTIVTWRVLGGLGRGIVRAIHGETVIIENSYTGCTCAVALDKIELA